jgi:uncharacterized protein (TIGR01244 family)
MLFPLAGALVAAAALSAVGAEEIKGFYRIDEGVAVGGQPTPEQVPALAAAGFRTVMNLRLESEFDAEPVAAAAKKAGLSYRHVPISSKDPTNAAVDEFLRLTDDPAIYPVYIYCGSGNRAAALWMVRRVLREGWHIGTAMTEAERAGLETDVMRDFAFEYIRLHPVARTSSK